MNLSLSQSCRQTLSMTGGVTETVFPHIEALLNDSTDYWEALQHVARRKSMDRYHSVIDFLFCESFPRYRSACFRYYDDKGPKLKDMTTAEQIERFEALLVKVLETAVYALNNERKRSWCWVVSTALREAV